MMSFIHTWCHVRQIQLNWKYIQYFKEQKRQIHHFHGHVASWKKLPGERTKKSLNSSISVHLKLRQSQLCVYAAGENTSTTLKTSHLYVLTKQNLENPDNLPEQNIEDLRVAYGGVSVASRELNENENVCQFQNAGTEHHDEGDENEDVAIIDKTASAETAPALESKVNTFVVAVRKANWGMLSFLQSLISFLASRIKIALFADYSFLFH